MDGCRICGGLTRRASRLCAGCGADLDDYETFDSRTADLLIPVRRYGGAPPAPAVPLEAPGPPRAARRRPLLALACAGAALAAALGLAALLAG